MSTGEKAAFWVVTGAASGIGAAVVRAARRSGANVLALDVDEAKGVALWPVRPVRCSGAVTSAIWRSGSSWSSFSTLAKAEFGAANTYPFECWHSDRPPRPRPCLTIN